MYYRLRFGMFVCLIVMLSQNASIVNSACAADAVVCPKYPWMNWGSYQSWYALHHPDKTMCGTSYPVNYNTSSGSTQSCPHCDPVTVSKSVLKSANTMNATAYVANGNELNNHQLDEPWSELHTSEDYYNLKSDQHYKLKKGKTSRDLFVFDAKVKDQDGNIVLTPIYVMARHIHLKREKDPEEGEDPELYPQELIRNVGQEVTEEFSENFKPKKKYQFTTVDHITSVVDRLDSYVVQLKVQQKDGSWWIYHINTHTRMEP